MGGADPNGSPPDGGLRAWFVMLASFLCNGIIFSIINTYSVIYLQLQKDLETSGVSESSSKAALVGSLAIGTTFLMSPVAGLLTDTVGMRATALVGAVMAALGMLLSSFLTHSVEGLYISYGLIYGAGASLVYTPSLVVLGHYFKKHLATVNGLVTAGSSLFTMLMPFLVHYLIQNFGLDNSLRCLAGLMLVLVLSASIFTPVLPPMKKDSGVKKSALAGLVNTDIWKEKKYVIWAFLIPVSLFGYFVPYVHMVKFVSLVFPADDGKLLVLLIGVSSGLGRVVFGRLADNPKVNRILLQQISFVLIGILTMLMPATTSFEWLEAISLGMGLFDGCFISLLGPIAFDLCGSAAAGQAIGCLLGLCSIPLTLGPPIAGLLYDHMGSYTIPLVLAGVPPVVGGLALTFVHFVKPLPPEGSEKRDPEAEDTEWNALVAKSEINGAKPS